jgi:anti-sigma-K factor RskA
MMSQNDGELLRLLRGELVAEQAAALRARLATDAGLRSRYAVLERTWAALGDDPAVEPRLGFSTAVLARARAEAGGRSAPSWSAAPAWARAAAVLALVAGVALGSGITLLGRRAANGPGYAVLDTPAAEEAGGLASTLAEDYADALLSATGDDFANDEARP